MTKEEAIAKYESKWWEDKSSREITQVQLYEERLVCPFDVFHKAVEDTLGRPVWTHEFASDSIQKEFEGSLPTATFEDVINKIPQNKLVVVMTDNKEITDV